MKHKLICHRYDGYPYESCASVIFQLANEIYRKQDEMISDETSTIMMQDALQAAD
jgi:hypothetical protein